MGIPECWKRHSPLPHDIEERLESLAPLLEKKGVLLAYLFGSLATKGEKAPRQPGDVDLAVLTEEEPAWRLQEALVEWLGTERTGTWWICAEPLQCCASRSSVAAGPSTSLMRRSWSDTRWRRFTSTGIPNR